MKSNDVTWDANIFLTVPMQSFSSESMGAGWSTIVNLMAVTTVLRAKGEPVETMQQK